MNLSIANWKKGQTGRGVRSVTLETKTTTPPKPYTEGTLLAAMKGAARFITEPKLREALREAQGIGTPATRASIIERLKEVGVLHEERKGKDTKYLRSTKQGQQIVAILPQILTDPGTTAIWEQMLELISRGEMTLEDFMARQVNATSKLVSGALATEISVEGDSSKKSRTEGTQKPPKALPGDGEKCPKCGTGIMQTRKVNNPNSKAHGKTYLSCSCYPQCKHAVWP